MLKGIQTDFSKEFDFNVTRKMSSLEVKDAGNSGSAGIYEGQVTEKIYA